MCPQLTFYWMKGLSFFQWQGFIIVIFEAGYSSFLFRNSTWATVTPHIPTLQVFPCLPSLWWISHPRLQQVIECSTQLWNGSGWELEHPMWYTFLGKTNKQTNKGYSCQVYTCMFQLEKGLDFFFLSSLGRFVSLWLDGNLPSSYQYFSFLY